MKSATQILKLALWFEFFQAHCTFFKFPIIVVTKSRVNYFPHIEGSLHHCMSAYASSVTNLLSLMWGRQVGYVYNLTYYIYD